ncbi:MAG: SDR family NAD(P)-dependent oxidoreductase [Psychromonas sp.]
MSNKKNLDIIETVQDKKLNSRLQECPIAIVGMASVFAETKNLEQFWDNIVESVNGIKDIPEDRWAIDDYYSSDKKAADKTYCKRGGFLPEIDFDPMEFGLPPNILELTDITQLMSLVVARDVLADAGISDENAYDRDKIGITLGVGGGQKQIAPLTSRLQGPILDKVLKASGVSEADRNIIIDKYKKAYIPWEENSFPGMLGNVIAGRIANRFDFGGTNCVVDAACAGSLAAIKMAVSDLLEYRSEMMISGGVCCDNSPFMYMSFSKTPAFTDGDDIRPFDENSKGMMIGEGVGMIALKRLEDAERDGDKIYALIKGIGSSSDGRFKSIYAPRPSGQVKALKRAYQDAGFDPLTCGLIEAHGTGTKAGDAAEFSALNTMFSENNEQKQHIALGTVKSQVGHTKAAAGTAGMIKAALALHHKVLPATINVDNPNPTLEIENSPLYINNETRPWMPRADGIKRRAGISSFGFGGTNYHFVLEEYKASHDSAYRLNEVPQTFVLSANNKSALTALLKNYLTKLSVEIDLQAYAFNKLLIENPFKTPTQALARCGFIAKNANQAIEKINQIIEQLANETSSWSNPSGIYYRETGLDVSGKVVALFSGQGSQYVNMGRDLTCNFPSMLASSAQMDKQFHNADRAPLSSTVFPIPVFSAEGRKAQEEALRLTQHAQPAIGAFSAGLFKTFKQAGLTIDFAAGHSFGELTALWAADVVSDDDYMLLARSRGAAMAAPEGQSVDASFDSGTMAAVVGAPEKVAEDIKDINDVSIANYNSNNQVVIAGKTAQIEIAVEQLQGKGYKVVKLPVSAAFHTELVGHAQKPFADVIDSVEFNTPTIPVFANGTGKAHANNGAKIKHALKDHILQSVHFNQEIDNLYEAGGRIFVEFGPKNVLTRLVDNILADKDDVVTIAVNNNAKKSADQQLRLAAVEMAVLGLELDNIDPYSAQQRPLVSPKKSPLAMKLTGASYVNPKTQKAFNDALNDGWKISSATPEIIVKEVIKEVIVEKIVEVEKIVYVQKNGTDHFVTTGTDDAANAIERSVENFVNHQSQLLDVHQAYMQGPQEYAKTFQAVLSAQAGTAQLSTSLDKTLGLYHHFQSETLRVHETYLNNQTDNMSKMLNSFAEQTHSVTASLKPVAPVVNIAPQVASDEAIKVAPQPQVQTELTRAPTITPVAPSVAPALDLNKIQSVMLAVVADKTGYPTEMLELSMDMEADLGIDSIKRVEILGAVQDDITDLPELNPEDLAELRTLGEIVNYMQSKAGDVVVASPVTSVSAATTVASAPIDLDKIQRVMMSVVADKTGYPTEMLELSMDMEADLGIDSIKRVEILGAVQDDITDLPELNPEDLAELRTLGEIVTYMQSKAGNAVSAITPVVSEINHDFIPAPSRIVVVKHIDAVIAQETTINGENLLLVNDGEGSAIRLAAKLTEQGWSVTVLTPSWVTPSSSKSFAKSINVIKLEALDEQELQTILATQASWQSVIYLQAKSTISGIEYPPASKQGLQLAFLLAKLTGLAKNSNNDVRSSFLVVTRQGGAFGVEDNETSSDLVQTGLTGLAKTLSHEWPTVFCRAIDVATKFGADKVANIVFDEFNDSQKLPVEVGFNKNGRLTLIGEKTNSYALTQGNSIDQHSLFLVSGGAKGVTAHCVIRLAQTYQCKFILLGRSDYQDSEPSWAKGINDEVALKKAAMQHLISHGEKPTPVAVTNFIKPVLANREIKQTLDAIESVGGIAQYVSADVTDKTSVKKAVSSITDVWGDITGIMHGAGVLADKFIEQKSLTDFEAVYRTKIDGLLSLLSCTEQNKIKHLVLFSSAAGFYGNPGQSDYAIANDILNKTAYRFKKLNPTAQVLSFNWGPWDGGMVTAALKRMFKERGVYIIPLDAGAQLLVSELAADSNRCPQILVGNDMGGESESDVVIKESAIEENAVKKPEVSRLSKNLLATNNAFFSDHQISGHAVFPTVCAIAWMVEAATSTYVGYQYLGLTHYKLLKGIIFDGTQASDYSIALTLLSDDAEKLTVEVKITSVNDAEKAIFHYSAVLLLAKDKPNLPVYEGSLPALCTQSHDLYDNGTLFHGESLQGITAVNHCDEQGLLLSCLIHGTVQKVQGEFDVLLNNVFANDLVYQALLVWVRKQLGLGSLPTATANWTVYQEVPVDQPFYLVLNMTTNRRNKKVTADITLINEKKQILACIEGVQVTASESLNDLFLKVTK